MPLLSVLSQYNTHQYVPVCLLEVNISQKNHFASPPPPPPHKGKSWLHPCVLCKDWGRNSGNRKGIVGLGSSFLCFQSKHVQDGGQNSFTASDPGCAFTTTTQGRGYERVLRRVNQSVLFIKHNIYSHIIPSICNDHFRFQFLIDVSCLI